MTEQHLYRIYGLPVSYQNVRYSDTVLSKIKQQDIMDKIARAPNRGLLAIQGTAAPVVNQLLEANRKTRGIDFIEVSATAFENHLFPLASVVVLYNVGSEVSTNFNISGQVLRKIIKFYNENNTLLIIETDLAKSELLRRYDVNIVNFIKLQPKPEEAWI